MAHTPLTPVLVAAIAATTASQAFKDVPAGHWAERAVTEVAVQRGFMVGYPDQTFRGQRPFTRAQLATALDELIDELEALSKTTWLPKAAAPVRGLPADPAVARHARRVAGSYGLFQGMPGYAGDFDGERAVTRYEMAWLIAALLRLGEARGVVDHTVNEPRTFAFRDVKAGDWAGEAEPTVKAVADRYQVMIGFPDGVFRGPERLTRYQFAAAAAQTFPLIRALVIRTQERKQATPSPAPTPAPIATPTPVPRFLEGQLLQAAPLLRVNNVVGLGGLVRHASYAGPWFLMADAQLGVPVCTSEIFYGGTLGLGYALPAGPAAYVQPFVGGRFATTGATHLAGPAAGAIAHARPAGPFGFYALGQGVAPLWTSPGPAPGWTAFLPQGAAGVTWHVGPGLALGLDLGAGLWPRSLAAPGTTMATDWATTVGTTVTLGF